MIDEQKIIPIMENMMRDMIETVAVAMRCEPIPIQTALEGVAEQIRMLNTSISRESSTKSAVVELRKLNEVVGGIRADVNRMTDIRLISQELKNIRTQLTPHIEEGLTVQKTLVELFRLCLCNVCSKK